MMMIILSMCTLLPTMFLFMNHPLAMGLMLLLQTLVISVSTGLFTPTFWFSYILFLVFLGGMLVLFIYVASLASNEMFSLSPKLTMLTGPMIFMVLTLTYITDPMNLNVNSKFLTYENMNQLVNLLNDMIFKMYDLVSYHITILMIFYLLLTLIIIVNIVTVNSGPLRPMN